LTFKLHFSCEYFKTIYGQDHLDTKIAQEVSCLRLLVWALSYANTFNADMKRVGAFCHYNINVQIIVAM